MLLERKFSLFAFALGVLLLIGAVGFGWGGEKQESVIFLAIDCLFFSLISAVQPRSDDEWRHGALESIKFALLSLSILAFIAGAIYLVAGSAGLGSEEGFMALLVLGLPAALVLPPILRRFYRTRRGQ